MQNNNLQISKRKYQCFISSTYDDLREERSICINAILDAGQIPAGMEYFEAGRPQRQIIEKWMAESDMVIFIIGGRYGTIDKITGNGYTEGEFDYVIKNGKPHFSIILSDLYLKKKEADYLQGNMNISIYEEKGKSKYREFIEKVRQDECVEVNSKQEIKLAVLKNIFKLIQSGELTGGWIKNEKDHTIDISEAKVEEKKQILLDLIKECFVYSSYRAEERRIVEQYYGFFQKYHQSLKKYMTSMAYSIEIKLYDDYIEEYSIANKTYKLAENAKSSFLYNPWLNKGMECETFEIENLKYNNIDVEKCYIKRDKPSSTDNPLYVKDVVKVEFPFDEGRDIHRVQYSTKYRISCDEYFHEYIFKEFCQHLSLMVSLQDCRVHKNGKKYMLKWELFSPSEKYDYLSQSTLEYYNDKLTLNIADLLLPGNGYVITLGSAPIGMFKTGKDKD